jgi:hypothetical protein
MMAVPWTTVDLHITSEGERKCGRAVKRAARRVSSFITAGATIALGIAISASAQTPPQLVSDPMANAMIGDYGKFLVRRPPASLGLDSFYQKYVDAEGIPIISSPRVPDAALLVARDIVETELANRPDIRHELVHEHARVGVMAIDEGTTDLPEQRNWKKPTRDDPRLTRCERANYGKIAAMTDQQYWNNRARGMGGRYTTSAAENLLGVPHTRYYGENILVHEFSHGILSAVKKVDPALYGRVQAAYRHAKAAGLWKGTYSAVTVQEYWAEGTQYWFNSNKVFELPRVFVLSDQDLRKYDPMLYAVLGEVYGDIHHIPSDAFYDQMSRIESPPLLDNC